MLLPLFHSTGGIYVLYSMGKQKVHSYHTVGVHFLLPHTVPLEWTCSEVEKLTGEVSFLRAKFSFPRSNGPFSRSDSCQNRAKRDFGSPD